MEQRWDYQRQVFIHKINIAAAPEYLCDNYVHASSRQSVTRAANFNEFCLPRSFTNWGRRRLLCHGVNQWNRLPNHFRMCNDTNAFKRDLKCAIKNGLIFLKF